jgi:hypothetical protein
MTPAWLVRLVVRARCTHHWVVRGDGDGILWLECAFCETRSVGWIVHAPRGRS